MVKFSPWEVQVVGDLYRVLLLPVVDQIVCCPSIWLILRKLSVPIVSVICLSIVIVVSLLMNFVYCWLHWLQMAMAIVKIRMIMMVMFYYSWRSEARRPVGLEDKAWGPLGKPGSARSCAIFNIVNISYIFNIFIYFQYINTLGSCKIGNSLTYSLFWTTQFCEAKLIGVIGEALAYSVFNKCACLYISSGTIAVIKGQMYSNDGFEW